MTKAKQAALLRNELQRSWHWLLVLGILFILFGTIGLGMVAGVTMASMFFLGLLLMMAGLSQLIDGFKSKQWRGAITHDLIAVLYMVIGCFAVKDPFLTSSIITAVIAGSLIAMGLLRLIMVAIMFRQSKGWGWLVLAGLSSIVLGVLILMQWPYSGLWFIGLFIAIELIISGWTYVLLALAIRKA